MLRATCDKQSASDSADRLVAFDTATGSDMNYVLVGEVVVVGEGFITCDMGVVYNGPTAGNVDVFYQKAADVVDAYEISAYLLFWRMLLA